MKIIFPPRPKGKMHPKELGRYESTGKWVAQRKFRGSRCLIYVSKNKEVTIANRHGGFFANFFLDKLYQEEIIDGLKLGKDVEYWLDGELMNKDVDAKFDIILFDLLQAGRYLFGFPNQVERLELLKEICNSPKSLNDDGIALKVTRRLSLAETFEDNFILRFEESLKNKQLEGLVLRKKLKALDNHGSRLYETDSLIRCRKPFACETFKANRSGGYEF